MNRVLSLARYVIVLGVIASLLLSIAVIVTSVVRAGLSIAEALPRLADAKTAKQLAVAGIEVADLLLIATVLYIIATGLYELFIGDVDLPAWITVTSLTDLKTKLISVIVAVMGVTFLSQVVNWNGATDLLPFGSAIALVVLALTAFGLMERGAKVTVKGVAPSTETIYGDPKSN